MRVLLKGCLVLLVFCFAQASVGASSDVARAKHLIGQVERGLTRIKPQDVASINGYTDKLKQAQTILEAETDKQDPGFRATAQQWMAARERLYKTLEAWKADPPVTSSTTTQAAQRGGPGSAQLYAELIAKYQSQSRPQLPAELDVAAGRVWTNQMLNLYGAQWQQDNAKAKQLHSAGQLSQADYDRFQRWVNGTWHQQIGEQINQAYGNWDRTLAQQVAQAQGIIAIDRTDRNKVMNSAGGTHLANNQALLAQSRDLLALVTPLETALGKPQDNLRAQQKQVLATAEQHLQQLVPIADEYLAAWKKAPKKSNRNPNSQYLWLNGSRFAEITQKGEVWINSKFVGSISSNGEIYARGSYMGKLEPDGKLWLSKQNKAAQLMENGEVWLGGAHIGTVYPNGEVSGAGSAASVEGPGDWRRAAVVYFLNVFPN